LGVDLDYDLPCQRFGLFKIISAAITPGIHPQAVKIATMMIEPQPLSRTAKGGKTIDNKTRQKLMAQKYGIFSRWICDFN